ncbi:MAG: sigma-70 family RNA polymerase sigma factor [Defluviitaleaceae bacterium]|nr:sigma-70 family RNA polymerase sigma factor [Defluviitaleaceae bacterium]
MLFLELAFYITALETDYEKETFAKIYKETRFAGYYKALETTKNPAMAEDALHNAFVSAIKEKEKFFAMTDDERKSAIVIYAKNAAIDLQRAKFERTKSDLDEASEVSDNLDLCDTVISDAGYQQVISAIRSLPEIYRVVFELRHVRDLSNQEIAEELGILNTTVSKRIERAKLKLRDLLCKDGAQ